MSQLVNSQRRKGKSEQIRPHNSLENNDVPKDAQNNKMITRIIILDMQGKICHIMKMDDPAPSLRRLQATQHFHPKS